MPISVTDSDMASSPPLLLLAGWGQSSRFWDRFLPSLEGYQPVTVDNRETGSAGPCPEGFTIEDLAGDALAAADREGLGRFTLLGHSMGGFMAQALAFAAPERIERLILVSAGPGQPRGIAPDASALTPPPGLELPADPDEAAMAVRAAFYEMYMAPGGDPPRRQIAVEEARRAHGNSADLDGLVRQLQALTSWTPPGDLMSLGLDVTVVHGDLDPLVPYANGQIVAELAGVPLTTLTGIGHMVPWEAPNALARVIRSPPTG